MSGSVRRALGRVSILRHCPRSWPEALLSGVRCRSTGASTDDGPRGEESEPRGQRGSVAPQLVRKPRLDARDIIPESLEATLNAHIKRNAEASPVSPQRPLIRYYDSGTPPHPHPTQGLPRHNGRSEDRGGAWRNPETVRTKHRSRSRPWEGQPIFSSFEDFKAQHPGGKEELFEKIRSIYGLQVDSTAQGSLGNEPISSEDVGASFPDLDQHQHNGGIIPRQPSPRPSLDYSVGKARGLRGIFGFSPELPSQLELPESHETLRSTSESVISNGIYAFERYISLTVTEKQSIDLLVAYGMQIIRSTFPDATIVLHGSHATGLATPLSGIDINLPPSKAIGTDTAFDSTNNPRTIGRRLRKPLVVLKAAFAAGGRASTTDIVGIRHPLLVVQDRDSGIAFQISSGRYTAAATQETLSSQDEIPNLRPLFMILRHYLLGRDLCHVPHGGIGSYPLLGMILTALKQSKTLPHERSIARQLQGVLDFWCDADLRRTGYAATPPFTFTKYGNLEESASGNNPGPSSNRSTMEEDPLADDADRLQNGVALIQAYNRLILNRSHMRRHIPRGPWQLSLQDPADPTNDLARAAYLMPSVIATLRELRDRLQAQMTRWDAATVEQRLASDLYPMRLLLLSNYRPIEVRRSMLTHVLAESSA